jgi:hypothetical protein
MEAKGKPLNTSKPPSREPASGLSLEARVRRRAGVVLRHVAGEHMLVPAVTREVDLDSLFLLNATGVFAWEHLDGQRQVRDLGEDVAKNFSTRPEAATADVARFLSNLLARNLAELVEDDGR